jgi:hypothetical protein
MQYLEVDKNLRLRTIYGRESRKVRKSRHN